MNPVLEHRLVNRLAARLPRTPRQLNRIHESDAELLPLPECDAILAVTTDGLAEELATGLYRDPWHIGWMLVTVNASDLAAVGAAPFGLLLCESLPGDVDPDWVDTLQRGIADAAITLGFPVLGGDTNTSATLHLSATALGIVRGAPPLTRRGACAGDGLYASGPLGSGGAYALGRMGAAAADPPFRPVARLVEGQLLRGRASACMDTSDGAIATLDELMTQSGIGFHLDAPVDRWTSPRAVELARSAGLAPWMLHAGPHGEFELLFTVPSAREAEMLRAAERIGWAPVRLGAAVHEPGLTLHLGSGAQRVDARYIRNLFALSGGDPALYVESLTGYASSLEPAAGRRHH